MLQYNPKVWFSFIFKLHKADTVRNLFPMILCIGAYAGLVAYWEIEYLKLSDTSHVKNLTLLHNLLGFVLSLLLVFRTNTAYDRWWEGRKLWGNLVNNSRNLAIKLNSILPSNAKADRVFFRNTIPLYAQILAKHLESAVVTYELDELDHPELKELDAQKHLPNQIASLMIDKIYKLYKEEHITGDMLITLNAELQSFTDVCGACERIKNTPIPFSYSLFVKKFIFFYVMTLPFGFVFSLGYYVIPVSCFVFYVLASLELIGEEIEDPFDGDPNDLPMEKIAANIKKHVRELIGI